ncbi:MAG TPA: hypothetical protein PKN22_02685 [Taishania sp.]|nr:hypothetical protein [Taishania sp.]HNS41640.1 hypothetical protein [Taishania sp.]
MKQILIFLIFTNILTTFSYSQIQIGGDEKAAKKEKKKKEKVKPVEKDFYDFRVYVSGTLGSSYRLLKPNTKNPLFMDSLGQRANETRSMGWGTTLGFTSDLSKYLMWEAGFSYFQNSEKYSYQATDTSHTYTSKYTWIGIPLKLHFKYDLKKVRFNVGAGVLPQMQFKYKQDDEFVNHNGKTTTSSVKTIKDVNTFGISVVANAGIHYSFTKRFGAFLQFEYRQQLTPSHLKTYPYIHKGNNIGATFGFTLGF